MTKFLIAIVSLIIGWIGGRSLSLQDIESVNATPAVAEVATYKVPGEGLQTMQVQLDEANLRVKNLEAQLADRSTATPSERPLNDIQALALKRAFEDLQGDVAAGKYPGLALSESYQSMNKILSNPEIK